MASSDKKVSKILIMGLDNSGKTSIILSLKQKTNLMSYFSLKPTQGLEIVNFDIQDQTFNIWDFGGQDRFRQDYLKNFNKYIKEVDKLIYIIDVQDVDKYELSLKYLESIVETLKNEKITLEFSIFLHKFDPNLEKLDNFTAESISKNLVEKINQIISSDFKYRLFKTTIYTVFQKSLIG